jgi:hypothetical protein
VYLASDLSAQDVSPRPSTWVDTVYLSIPRERIVALALENENGTFEFEVGEGGAWTMSGLAPDETASGNNIESLVSRVSSLRMLRPLGTQVQDAYGLQSPGAVVRVHTQDEEGASKTTVLQVGAVGDEEGYVVKSSASDYYVRVAEYAVQDMLEKARQDFLELPPTPTPQPAS